jgi:hypothetical protein
LQQKQRKVQKFGFKLGLGGERAQKFGIFLEKCMFVQPKKSRNLTKIQPNDRLTRKIAKIVFFSKNIPALRARSSPLTQLELSFF